MEWQADRSIGLDEARDDARDRDRTWYSYGYHWYVGEVIAGTPPRSHHWVGGIGWGGQCVSVLPTLDLVLAINCGNYHKSRMEQLRIISALLTEIVLPSFV